MCGSVHEGDRSYHKEKTLFSRRKATKETLEKKNPKRQWRPIFLLLGLGDSDGDGLALGKQLVAVLVILAGELGDQGGGAVVGNEGSQSSQLAAVRTLDLNIGTVGVQLTVADGVVPQPHEGDLARGGVGGDLDVGAVLAKVGHVAQAVADQGLDDNPGLAVVVRQGPLAVSTAVGGANVVVGLDGLAGLVDGTLAGEGSLVLADGEVDTAVDTDGGADVVVDALALGRGEAASKGAVAGAGGFEGDVGVDREDREGGNGESQDGGFEHHFRGVCCLVVKVVVGGLEGCFVRKKEADGG